MTTAIESKQDATKQSQKEQLETFSCMLDIGEAMLATGADVDTVEDILVKMGKAYGAYKIKALVRYALLAALCNTVDIPRIVLTCVREHHVSSAVLDTRPYEHTIQ